MALRHGKRRPMAQDGGPAQAVPVQAWGAG